MKTDKINSILNCVHPCSSVANSKGFDPMKSFPALRRWLSLGGAAAVFAVVLAIVAVQGSSGDDAKSNAKADAGRSWPMFGGHPSRNFVNLVEKNLPVKWS